MNESISLRMVLSNTGTVFDSLQIETGFHCDAGVLRLTSTDDVSMKC